MNVNKVFFKYVSQNILGMIGISLYILADTFFIAQAVGANGITALNLVLPVYSLIFAIGAMIGVGSTIRFTIAKNRAGENPEGYFGNAIICAAIISTIFIIIGGVMPDKVVEILGGDGEIVEVGASYTRIFMMFAPMFMWNHICNAFVRNDGAPSVAMAATLISSLFNIVFDYVLMFPLNMAMEGAALATALSPVVGILVCGVHFASKKNTVPIKLVKPSFTRLMRSCQVGISAFVGEISSGVITVVFNTIILGIAGNTGVAAYGVVANISLVAVAMFNGVSQGSQPLVSEFYGKGDWRNVRKVLGLAVKTSLVLAVAILAVIYIWTTPIANIFNSEGDMVLQEYAKEGLKLYFIGFLFAGINIVGTGVLSAIESAKWAFIASILRGFVVIILCAFVLSYLLQMTGVWLAFPVAELITVVVTSYALVKSTM